MLGLLNVDRYNFILYIYITFFHVYLNKKIYFLIDKDII